MFALRRQFLFSCGGGSRLCSQQHSPKAKTGIMLLNMGGPETTKEVQNFLTRLFFDKEIIRMPFQDFLARFIAWRRSPKIEHQYSQIGGGSPILHWTKIQGEMITRNLDIISPETAPHKFYVAFRYVHPLVESCVNEMERDCVERVVAFSQYPQYSCTTAGSSLNAIVRHYESNEKMFNGVESIELPFLPNNSPGPIWSFIDRWPVYPSLVNAFASKILKELQGIRDEKERANTVLIFSAHSIPLSVVNRGDPYPQEVGATVHAIMKQLNFSWPYRLTWQSKVGPAAWLGPSTADTLYGLSRLGYRHAILIPVAFTLDHIETLYEMDVEYCTEVASKAGMVTVRRSQSLNDDPAFSQGLAELVLDHLRRGEPCSKQFMLRCPMCTNPSCERTRKFIMTQKKRLHDWTNVHLSNNLYA
ncbi:Ferrochelatase isoform 2 [Schistosoma japonicum]|uniref:Ferrochelatase n=2 Tax=Schistosoma japonicum TaxID=6182 RepID=A0A4Z2DTH0_SCHJA|nr:Ferrochelatase isoform 2 [Schistosoma japonicum]